ncbi:MAG: 1-deoxy-D-xylulose-5-phosphate synthase, partial [Flavobacteriales bacterium]|nr:1-deoxy-D-xylulose-5-phosphate synthase [Flavobacteriales bacterium]
PRNEIELRNIMFTAQLGLEQPMAIRYPRGRGVTINWKQRFEPIEIGKGVQLKSGTNLAILTFGTISKNVEEAIKNCDNKNAIAHYDMRFAKPLDEALLHTIFKKFSIIITVEDNAISGGFGSAILEFASKHNYTNPIKILGIPDAFIEHGRIAELQEFVGLNADRLTKCFNALI